MPVSRPRRRLRLILSVLLISGLLVVAVLAVLRYTQSTVTITTAVEGPIVQAFYATGTVLPVREYPIRSNVAGILTSILVDKGQHVHRGDLLAVITDDERVFKARQAVAERDERRQLCDEQNSPVLREFDARLTAATEMLDIAQRDRSRLTSLIERQAASQQDLDRSIDREKQLWSEVESCKAQRAARKLSLLKDLEVANAAVAMAEWNLDLQQIRSPIDGVVLDRPASLSTRLAINDHIMQVADVQPNNLVMRAAVDEEDINKVLVNQTVKMTLYAFPNSVLDGVVSRIYDKADETRRTFEVDIRFTDHGHLLLGPVAAIIDAIGLRELYGSWPAPSGLDAGLTGELAFVMESKERAVVIPSQAVQSGKVWEAVNGVVRPLDAVIGLRGVERTEILTGLQPGQQVVISPIGALQPGEHVQTTAVDPNIAAGLNRPPPSSTFKGF